eukprot:gene8272-97_t
MQIEAFRKCQALTGIFFSSYLFLHLFTHMFTLLGEDEFNTVLVHLRKIYQNIFYEVTLLSSIVLHIFCALTLWIKRKKRKIQEPVIVTAFRWSGWFIMFIIPIHFYYGRISPYLYNIEVNFAYSAYTLSVLQKLFFPYYLLFTSFAVVHSIVGFTKGLEILKFKSVNLKMSVYHYLISIVMIVIMVLVLLSYGGYFYEIDKYSQFGKLAEYFDKLGNYEYFK